MRVSLERLLETADATGFRPEMLEKAIQLMHLLQSIQEHPDLEDKLVLKGGTALNLFYFDVASVGGHRLELCGQSGT